MTKLLAFSGSCRKESLNARLVSLTAELAREAGAEVQLVSLTDFDMPIYNGDLEDEAGIPKRAQALRSMMVEYDGMIVGCPEYNGSITPLLKNTIDWTSRPDGEDAPGLIAYQGKIIALVAASPGILGGIRGLAHVRAILSGIGAHVIPKQMALSQAHQSFGDDQRLSDQGKANMLQGVVDQLVEVAGKLS